MASLPDTSVGRCVDGPRVNIISAVISRPNEIPILSPICYVLPQTENKLQSEIQPIFTEFSGNIVFCSQKGNDNYISPNNSNSSSITSSVQNINYTQAPSLPKTIFNTQQKMENKSQEIGPFVEGNLKINAANDSLPSTQETIKYETLNKVLPSRFTSTPFLRDSLQFVCVKSFTDIESKSYFAPEQNKSRHEEESKRYNVARGYSSHIQTVKQSLVSHDKPYTGTDYRDECSAAPKTSSPFKNYRKPIIKVISSSVLKNFEFTKKQSLKNEKKEKKSGTLMLTTENTKLTNTQKYIVNYDRSVYSTKCEKKYNINSSVDKYTNISQSSFPDYKINKLMTLESTKKQTALSVNSFTCTSNTKCSDNTVAKAVIHKTGISYINQPNLYENINIIRSPSKVKSAADSFPDNVQASIVDNQDKNDHQQLVLSDSLACQEVNFKNIPQTEIQSVNNNVDHSSPKITTNDSHTISGFKVEKPIKVSLSEAAATKTCKNSRPTRILKRKPSPVPSENIKNVSKIPRKRFRTTNTCNASEPVRNVSSQNSFNSSCDKIRQNFDKKHPKDSSKEMLFQIGGNKNIPKEKIESILRNYNFNIQNIDLETLCNKVNRDSESYAQPNELNPLYKEGNILRTSTENIQKFNNDKNTEMSCGIKKSTDQKDVIKVTDIVTLNKNPGHKYNEDNLEFNNSTAFVPSDSLRTSQSNMLNNVTAVKNESLSRVGYLNKQESELFSEIAKEIQAHDLAQWNGKCICDHLAKKIQFASVLSPKYTIVACLVFGGIISGKPILVTEEIRRKYYLKTYLPKVYTIISAERPELPLDLPPKSYTKEFIQHTDITDINTISLVEVLLNHIKENNSSETGMSQQWAIGILLTATKISDSQNYKEIFKSLKPFMRTQAFINSCIKTLRNNLNDK